MDFNNVGNVLSPYQYADKLQKPDTGRADFMESLQGAEEAKASKTDAYREYLKERFGNVMIRSVGKDQKSMDTLGFGTSGAGNVVIAPNILEKMANDPEKAAYYEKKIQEHFDSLPQTKAFLALMGHRMISSGVVIHADGTVTYYLCGEVSPKKRAEIEAQIKAEDEAKAKRRRRYQELSKEAAAKRQMEMSRMNRQQYMTDILAYHGAGAGSFTYMGMSGTVNAAVTAYEMNVNKKTTA